MKLFENEIGRPSNETKRKRKIFIASIVSISFLIIICISYLLYGAINNKASLFSRPIVLYSDTISGSKASLGTEIKVRARFTKTRSNPLYYEISEELTGKKIKTCSVIPSDNKAYFSFILDKDKTQFKTTIYSNSNCLKKVSSFKTRKYYIKKSSIKNVSTTRKKISLNIIRTTTKKTTTSKNSISDISMSRYNDNWDIGAQGTVTVNLKNASSFTVKSSNPRVMRVKKINSTQYTIYAVSPGTATITATSSAGAKTSYTYKVKDYEYLNNSRVANGVKTNKTYNGINVIVENGCSSIAITRYLNDIIELPSYAAKPTKVIYFLTEATFNKLTNNSNQVGQTMMGKMYIDIKCNKYHDLVLVHEIAHNIDYYYNLTTGKGYISSKETYVNLFKKYKGKVLRDYSFTSQKEFFADSYSYYFHRYLARSNTALIGTGRNWKYNNEIKNEVKNTISEIKILDW